ncbi:MAG: tyrosine-type recombinase/integrase [Eubacteriales bacterium]
MKNQISEFEIYLKKNNKLSKHTIDAYMTDIHQFYAYLTETGFQNFSDITNAVLLAYCAKLQSKGLSKASILRKLSSIKKFYGYLNIKHNMGVDIGSFVDLPKHKKSLPKYISTQEINKLFDSFDTSTQKGQRDKAMLELLYATGMKVSELITLKLFDLSLEKMEVTLSDRDGYTTLPYPESTQRAIKKYLSDARPMITKNHPSDILFVNLKGDGMTRQGFWKIIKEQAAKAGVTDEVNPNTLRNSFAVHLINNGADVSDIKEMMGHSDVSTTQAYFEAAKSESLRRRVTKKHPRET